MDIQLLAATKSDLPEILELQKMCWCFLRRGNKGLQVEVRTI